jgi:flavin-binding protein dodecin
MTEPEQSVAEAIEAGDVTAEEVAEAEVDDQTGEVDDDAAAVS